jgi:hypothetical protein
VSGERFSVFRLGESPERGHRPVAVFGERWLALLAAAGPLALERTGALLDERIQVSS